MDRRTLTMNWDGLGDVDDDDDRFFESCDRISSAVPLDLANSSGSDDDDDDEEFDDCRLSFASNLSSTSTTQFRNFKMPDVGGVASFDSYNMWMAEPGDINDRRKRLLQGMGLASNKNLLRLATSNLNKVMSKKINIAISPSPSSSSSSSAITKPPSPPPSPPHPDQDESSKQQPSTVVEASTSISASSPEPSPSTPILLVRSRSDGDIESFSANTKRRKEQMIGSVSKQRLTRTSSVVLTPCIGGTICATSVRVANASDSPRKFKSSVTIGQVLPAAVESFFLIKNLDTGKEFIVKEFNNEGMWNKLSDLQTGKQLTMEEFEKTVGHSPAVKELMRRSRDGGGDGNGGGDDERKISANSYFSKSFRNSKRRGVALLKNIKGVANSMSGFIPSPIPNQNPTLDSKASTKNGVANANQPSSQWVKVRPHGKHFKEFTALYLCQEIQGHDGSIWTMKFSLDGRYLATAGEDRVIHVWEVQECDVMSMRPQTDDSGGSVTPFHPAAPASSVSEKPPLGDITPMPSEKRRRGKGSNKKKGNTIPDYVQVPETVIGFAEIPVCTFKGHLDDVLDLSWSKSQLLLSSSMDKTVRLWDLETKNCLKLFAHNDYVTCIQFNPVDDDYFISGSLDAKVRLWSIPNRQVVDWTDLNEMVTAVSYTPDGQGVIVGSHKGYCRLYSTTDCKLEQKEQVEIKNKKKSQPKKITGFQFAPWNSSEVLVTSADSRVRILDGTNTIHKFRGFRNTSSQISAAFSPDGKYVISASEDSQVYIWRCEEHRNVGGGKSRTTQSYEHFPCRDVSVAIPWPGSSRNEAPMVEIHSKRHSRRSIPQTHSMGASPTREEMTGTGTTSKRSPQLPPLPSKNSTTSLDRAASCPEDELGPIDPGIGPSDSFSSVSASARYDDSPASISSNPMSQSWSSSWSWFDGGHGNNTVHASAWGLVIVTAGLGGEIRTYQNFGFPFKVSRQPNLFRDLT